MGFSIFRLLGLSGGVSAQRNAASGKATGGTQRARQDARDALEAHLCRLEGTRDASAIEMHPGAWRNRVAFVDAVTKVAQADRLGNAVSWDPLTDSMARLACFSELQSSWPSIVEATVTGSGLMESTIEEINAQAYSDLKHPEVSFARGYHFPGPDPEVINEGLDVLRVLDKMLARRPRHPVCWLPNDTLGRVYPVLTASLRQRMRVFEPTPDDIQALASRGQLYGPWLTARVILLRIRVLSLSSDFNSEATGGRQDELLQIIRAGGLDTLITDHSQSPFSMAQQELWTHWGKRLGRPAWRPEDPEQAPLTVKFWPPDSADIHGNAGELPRLSTSLAEFLSARSSTDPSMVFYNPNSCRPSHRLISSWDDRHPFILPDHAFPFLVNGGLELVDSAEYAMGRLASATEAEINKNPARFPTLLAD